MVIRRFKALGALALLSAFALSVSMCSSSSTDTPPVITGSATLTLTASPVTLPADGATTDVSVAAVQEDGTIGNGTVTIQATNGSLGGGGTSATISLSNGRGTVKWSCNAASQASCVGSQTVTATWGQKVANATVVFTASGAQPDAGNNDAGNTDAGDGGHDSGPITDSGPDAPVDAAPDGPAVVQGTIALSASKSKIYLNANDFSTLTATLKQLDGGPIANEPVDFNTDLGTLALPDGGSANASLSTVTASNGTAVVIVKDTGATGTATVTAARPATGQTASTQVAIQAAQTMTYVSTKCAGTACTIMGVKTSGFNETANVTFKVTDAANNPVPGLTVNFSLSNAPAGTTTTASGVTDAQGLVSTTVTAGPTIGSFSVAATFQTPSGPITTSSPTIGIRGAIPSNKGFSFSCSRVNLDVYNAPTQPKAIGVTCSFTLVDRFNNAVGTGTSVNFKTEAGIIESSKSTTAYNPAPGGNNAAEGTGTVNFSTAGAFPALDVDPLPAAPGQYPNARVLEPSWQDGQLTRNPRDGLVTIIAYVNGEEYYSDDNANGTWDPGEQFYDQGEPFVDSNDNNIRDQGETPVDVNGNGVWDGPDGVWNKTTNVWAVAHVLYTDKPVAGNSSIVPPSFGTLPLGAAASINAYFLDLNLNYMSATGTTIGTEQTGPRTLGVNVAQGLLDDFGFDMRNIFVSTAGEGACTPSTPICKPKTVFVNWAGPNSGLGAVNAVFTNPSTSSPAGGPTNARIKATLGGTTLTLQSTGTTLP